MTEHQDGLASVVLAATTRPVTPGSTPAEIDERLLRIFHEIAHYSAVCEADGINPEMRARAEELLTRLYGAAAPLDAAYNERRWPRWYWVPKGHLHAEGDCPTLYQSTERNLHPPASGADGARAVELFGWHVCTVCYPDAPAHKAFRTPGTHAAAEADAAGDCLNKVPSDVRYGYSPYGRCGECGARGVAVTSLGNLRKHKHQRKADDAAREARINDPKLIGTATGEELRVDNQEIRTVRTAEIAYVDHMVYASWGHSRAEHRAHAATLAEALATKAGVTVDVIRERLAKRVAAKL